jgi:hypothetical protein
MMKSVSKCAVTTAVLALLLAVPAYGSGNKSINIAAGEDSDGASTVNGSISVGSGATVTGTLETVNGTIRIDRDARISDAETVNGAIRVADKVQSKNLATVNGSIRVGAGVTVDGSVEAVNGSIAVGEGSSVASDVGNVNGEIELTGTQVGGDISTVNGDVELAGGAVVRGDVIVRKPGGWNWRQQRKPRIVIGPGSRVEGTMRLEREVELYISESADVGGVEGEMTLDDAVRFSGKRP